MTLRELYDLGKSQSIMVKRLREKSKVEHLDIVNSQDLDNVCFDNIKSMSIMCERSFPFPDISLFPNLEDLHLYSLQLTPDIINRIPLKGIKSLWISFPEQDGIIDIDGKDLESLTIHIDDGNSPQMNLFSPGEKTINIWNANNLKSLQLNCCNNYHVTSNTMLYSLMTMTVNSSPFFEYNILKQAPNISELYLCYDEISNTSFLPNSLKKLSLRYNRVKDIEQFKRFKKLDYLDLIKNPLPDECDSLRFYINNVILNENDSVEYGINNTDFSDESRIAYDMVQSVRNDKNIEDLRKRFYDKKTDEELFLNMLRLRIDRDIEYMLDDNRLMKVSLKRAELVDLYNRRLPFLELK